MSARNVGIGEMFGWIPATFGLVGRNFGAMAGAAMLTILGIIVLMLPFVGVMLMSMKSLGSPDVPVPPSLGTIGTAYALTIVVGLVLFPPILAGWFRLCESADRNNGPSALQLLSGYKDGASWLRLIVYSLLGMVLYLLVMAVLALAFKGPFMDLIAMEVASMGGMAPAPDPSKLAGIFAMYAVMMPVGFLVQQVYLVGFAEVALRATSPVAALVQALQAIGRNVLKLLVFMLGLFFLAFVVGFIVALVAALVIGVLSLLGKGLMFLAIGVVYIALLLAIYPLMFSGNYFMWKSLMGGDQPPAIAA